MLLGNSIWDEKYCLCASNSAWYGNCIVCIMWESQHGERRVRGYYKIKVEDFSIFPLYKFEFNSHNQTISTFSSSSFLLHSNSATCQGCLVAPTLSIGSILLQQGAISASFHYNNVEIVESRPSPTVKHIILLIRVRFDL